MCTCLSYTRASLLSMRDVASQLDRCTQKVLFSSEIWRPKSLGAPVTFARLSRASFMSHLLAPPSCRAGPSLWLALWYVMVSHWISSHFLEYSPRNSFSNLKQHYSATLGLGALLSSPT